MKKAFLLASVVFLQMGCDSGGGPTPDQTSIVSPSPGEVPSPGETAPIVPLIRVYKGYLQIFPTATNLVSAGEVEITYRDIGLNSESLTISGVGTSSYVSTYGPNIKSFQFPATTGSWLMIEIPNKIIIILQTLPNGLSMSKLYFAGQPAECKQTDHGYSLIQSLQSKPNTSNLDTFLASHKFEFDTVFGFRSHLQNTTGPVSNIFTVTQTLENIFANSSPAAICNPSGFKINANFANALQYNAIFGSDTMIGEMAGARRTLFAGSNLPVSSVSDFAGNYNGFMVQNYNSSDTFHSLQPYTIATDGTMNGGLLTKVAGDPNLWMWSFGLGTPTTNDDARFLFSVHKSGSSVLLLGQRVYPFNDALSNGQLFLLVRAN